MPFTNYTELKAAVADWLNRSDLTTQIVDFIALTETDVNRRLRTRDQLGTSRATATGEYLALPDDWAEAETVMLETNPETRLIYLTPDTLDSYRPSYPSAGRPKFYTIVGRNLRFLPVPDTSYTTRMSYYKGVTALSAGSPTNWLLTRHPDCYLNGALLKAATFLRDADGIALAKTAFDDSMESIRTADDAAKYPAGMRMTIQPIG